MQSCNSFRRVMTIVFCHLSAIYIVQCREYCYSGSNLYQLETLDCSTKNSSAEWYCAKMEVCEAFVNSNRACVITRGCALKSQCINPVTNTIYDNTLIVDSHNVLPAGMTIKASCCSAQSFPDDDNIAIDYSKICNSSIGTREINVYVLFTSLVFGSLLVLYDHIL